MTKTTDTAMPALLPGKAGSDPIGDRLPANLRATIVTLPDEGLAASLGRIRYGRGGGARKGYRHGRREQGQVGTFGTETVRVPHQDTDRPALCGDRAHAALGAPRLRAPGAADRPPRAEPRCPGRRPRPLAAVRGRPSQGLDLGAGLAGALVPSPREPVLHDETVDAAKRPFIVGHERCAECQGLGGDPKVVLADGLAF